MRRHCGELLCGQGSLPTSMWTPVTACGKLLPHPAFYQALRVAYPWDPEAIPATCAFHPYFGPSRLYMWGSKAKTPLLWFREQRPFGEGDASACGIFNEALSAQYLQGYLSSSPSLHETHQDGTGEDITKSQWCSCLLRPVLSGWGWSPCIYPGNRL